MLNESGNVNGDVGSSCSFRGRKGRREEYGEQLEKTREERKLVSPSGRCARLTRTVKSPPAPFSTALAIRIERQCQGQGRPSPPCRRILSLSSLIPHPPSLFLFRGTHGTRVRSTFFPASRARPLGIRLETAKQTAKRQFFLSRDTNTRISTSFFKFLEGTRKNQRKIRFDSTCNRVSVERTRIWSINTGENAIFVYINPKQGFKPELGIKRILTYRCNITIFLFSRKSRLIKICNDTNLIYKYIRVI